MHKSQCLSTPLVGARKEKLLSYIFKFYFCFSKLFQQKNKILMPHSTNSNNNSNKNNNNKSNNNNNISSSNNKSTNSNKSLSTNSNKSLSTNSNNNSNSNNNNNSNSNNNNSTNKSTNSNTGKEGFWSSANKTWNFRTSFSAFLQHTKKLFPAFQVSTK